MANMHNPTPFVELIGTFIQFIHIITLAAKLVTSITWKNTKLEALLIIQTDKKSRHVKTHNIRNQEILFFMVKYIPSYVLDRHRKRINSNSDGLEFLNLLDVQPWFLQHLSFINLFRHTIICLQSDIVQGARNHLFLCTNHPHKLQNWILHACMRYHHK